MQSSLGSCLIWWNTRNMIDLMTELFQLSLAISIPVFLLWLLYRVALSKERRFVENRATLLFVYLASLVVGLVLSLNSVRIIYLSQSDLVGKTESAASLFSPVLYKLSVGWGVGVIVCLLLTSAEIIRILSLCWKAERRSYKGKEVYVTTNGLSPFSFGSIIMMSEADFKENPEIIMLHENAHIRYFHIFDLLLAQCFVIFCWYNPAVWFLKNELKAVHEYQADDYVLRSGCDAKGYQRFLLTKAVCRRDVSLINGLGYIQIRRRISMMNSPVSSHGRLRYLIPVVGVVISIVLLSLSPVKHVISHIRMEKVSAPATPATLDDMHIYVNGSEIDKSALNNIPPAEIREMTVNKKDNRIEIELKDE